MNAYQFSVNPERTGRKIMRLQDANHVKVSELQTYFGFETPQAIYKWRQGKSMPTVENLVSLARFFGCSLDDIVEYDDLGEGQRILVFCNLLLIAGDFFIIFLRKTNFI